MAKQKQAAAERLLDLAEVLEGRHLIAVSAGPNLDPVLLSLEQPPDYRTETPHGSFAKHRAATPNRFRVHYRAGEQWCFLDLPPTAENYHAVQPLPEGCWLLVRGRAAGGADRNARVYEADGMSGPAFHAGDGIADVQASERGRVWVSYFDEGVFGDDPLSQSGLVCFDQDGTAVFRLGDLPDPVLKSMADCYALNVCSDREAWLYFYTDFPLVRLLDGKVVGSWRMPVAGSHGFTVNGDRVLLAGSYGRKGSLFLVHLGQSRVVELTPVGERGRPLRKFRAFGRRDRLFLATDDALYVVDMSGL
jgi:hypothetical protein